MCFPFPNDILAPTYYMSIIIWIRPFIPTQPDKHAETAISKLLSSLNHSTIWIWLPVNPSSLGLFPCQGLLISIWLQNHQVSICEVEGSYFQLRPVGGSNSGSFLLYLSGSKAEGLKAVSISHTNWENWSFESWRVTGDDSADVWDPLCCSPEFPAFWCLINLVATWRLDAAFKSG